ncbi:Scytalone dehydratase [Xylona heveae TC161]|uniref:Scytalone dehydratase n=1 Tax=Xylona heveae (strain CBS 132557 / TC161) TaxID=1328760 RepID=A0A165FUS1_XYLHT|nr:Scytalone dehydratase [Xylona heveae TC161]KZF21406.1 Scytalone dehydratase [Xylona heveae TC161]
MVELKKPKITYEDYIALSELTFEWGDSYDAKDWDRLRKILAPTLLVDYTEVHGNKWEDMSSEEFVAMVSHHGFVGDPLVNTQHFIGASKWERISEDEAIGYHQLRAAHQRYTGPDKKTVEAKGHGHAMIKHNYRKVDGEWKFAGLRPTVRWNEFEFEKIFKYFD